MSVAEKIRNQFAFNAAFARGSLNCFLDSILIPSSPEPQRFGECADEWQRDMMRAKIPAFEHLAGLNPGYSGPLRFLDVLARGHNKSSSEAWLACWLLMASKRRIHGYVLAADRDQGRLIVQAADDFLRLNPWVDVTIQKDVFTGAAGEVQVLPFDARSNMGLRGNLYILDEIVHWKRQDEWTAIISGLKKVRPTVLAVMTNAGLLDTWQHDVYLEATAKPKRWSTFHRPGTLASWLDPTEIEEDRAILPPSEFKRLVDNLWIDPAEEYDYLRRSECIACEAMGTSLIYRLTKQVGVAHYIVGVDYGAKKDRTALVVLHVDKNGVVVIDRLEVWQGSDFPDGRVPVEKVENWLLEVRRSFSPSLIVLDPHQMEGTAQRLEGLGAPVERYNFRGGRGNFELAQHLRAIVATKRITWYPDAGTIIVKDKRTGGTKRETLTDELAGLRVKNMHYGFRFDHQIQKHDDRAFAIAIASLRAIQFYQFGGPPPTAPVRKPERSIDDEEIRRS